MILKQVKDFRLVLDIKKKKTTMQFDGNTYELAPEDVAGFLNGFTPIYNLLKEQEDKKKSGGKSIGFSDSSKES